MNEQHYYADVDLPFHVWVRETTGGKSRWVLRDASDLEGMHRLSTGSDSGRERSPGSAD